MQESNGGASAYDQVLKDFEITEPELKQVIGSGPLTQSVENNIAAENQVTEEQAQQFYQSNQDTYKEPAE